MKALHRKLFTLSIVLITGALATSAVSAQEASTIYVATNKTEGNTVAAYKRMAGGQFKWQGEYVTGGKGTGDLEIPALKKDPSHPLANGDDPLISAYGIVATDDKQHLLVVNAGDSSISLLRINPDASLSAVNTVAAGDKFPVSIATSGNRVVVASVGNSNMEGGIKAYVIKSGKLAPVEGSRRDLKARPSTVAFNGRGDYVIVSELVTGKIKSFGLDGDTLSVEPVSVLDSPRADQRFQAIPVGFDVRSDRGGDVVLMSEARFLTPELGLREEANKVPQSPKYSWQTGSLSSYHLNQEGQLKLVSGDVLTGTAIEGGEIANCWVVFSPNGKTLWAANALSSSISSFSISADGAARLKNATAYKDESELLFFSDLTVNESGTQLFQLVGNKGQVMIFDIQPNGDLTLNQTVDGLPELGIYGLVVL